MPISFVLGGFVDFFLAFIMLIAMMVYYGMSPTANVIRLPCFLMLAFITSLGASLWLSAMYVQFRYVRHIVPFLTQIWLFATPIAYPSSLLSEPWRTLYGINFFYFNPGIFETIAKVGNLDLGEIAKKGSRYSQSNDSKAQNMVPMSRRRDGGQHV